MENQTNIIPFKYPAKRCISCKTMWRKKGSEYCYRCDPNKSRFKYSLPSFNKLTTIQGIRKSYTNLLNAIRKNRISRDEANTMFYGLKCFISSLKDITDMRMAIDKTSQDSRSLITDVKIEQMKMLINKMEMLHNKFKQSNIPSPSGEIDSKIEEEDKIDI